MLMQITRFRGRLIKASYQMSHILPEAGCAGCKQPLSVKEYFYIHADGKAWHTKCHWAEPKKFKPYRIEEPAHNKLRKLSFGLMKEGE